jgi:hypothetical protein
VLRERQQKLRARRYDLVETGERERILPTAITEKLVTGVDGALEPLTPGSTRAVAMTTTHAGIILVRRYAFSMP